MKLYTDVFKKPITAEELTLATRLVVKTNSASSFMLQRNMKMGYCKIATILRLLEDAGVVTESFGKPRSVILKKEATAINAALRQLRKGNQ